MLSLSNNFGRLSRNSHKTSFRYVRQQKYTQVLKYKVLSQKGFGASNAKSSQKSKKGKRSGPGLADNWAKTCNINDFQEGKMTKAVILSTGKQLIIYKVGEDVYCSDAASTAFQYPLADAKIIEGENGPIVEVKLDGTQYELETGKVVKWCPQDNLVRGFLGKLKSDAQPIDLIVYPVQIDESGDIYADMMRGQ